MKIIKCAKCLNIKPNDNDIRWNMILAKDCIDIENFDGYVNICDECNKEIQSILNKAVFNFIQPERLSEKTSKEDAIV